VAVSTGGFFQIDDARLEYRRTHEGDNSPATLIFLHEGLGSVAMWKDFPERLSKLTGMNALVYSRRSYGKSSRLEQPRQVDYMHDEAGRFLPQVLERAGISEPVFIGHSDGGSIALIYTGAGLHPAPRALVLLAPHVFTEELSIRSIRRARQAWDDGDLRERLAPYHDDVDNAFRRWNDIWLDARFRSWNIEASLPAVTCPVLHIQGVEDEYGTFEQARAVRAGCRGEVEIMMLEECGHAPFRDQPHRTLAGIRAFLARHGCCAA